MDEAGKILTGILTDAFPDAHHVATGGVNEAAAFGLEYLHCGDFSPKSGDNHNVARFEVGNIGCFFFARKELDTHFAEVVIHIGVVDDFTQDVDWLVGVDFARGVGQVDGPLHAVAKAELFGQANRQPRRMDDRAGSTDFLD